MEFATRYMDRDPDGEIYGYGLSTRKVLRNIYDGMPWNEANKMVIIKEGTHSAVDKLVMGLSQGKGFHDTVKFVQEDITSGKNKPVKEGSCGNGSAMRVAPLGAFLASNALATTDNMIEWATKQSEPTHCHTEGIAGAIAITTATACLTMMHMTNQGIIKDCDFLPTIVDLTPPSIVRDGIIRATQLDLNTPITEAIKVLGNGTHVTCQDTVPLCCWLVQKHLRDYPEKQDEIYEKAIIETSMAFGDVDTNCAIVGGMLGSICNPPDKWVKFCKPMEGVL
jgi:ADP-ribosylglycohydrolase